MLRINWRSKTQITIFECILIPPSAASESSLTLFLFNFQYYTLYLHKRKLRLGLCASFVYYPFLTCTMRPLLYPMLSHFCMQPNENDKGNVCLSASQSKIRSFYHHHTESKSLKCVPQVAYLYSAN